MADVSYSVPGVNVQPVATQVRPVPATSLSDMLNVARGAQQYQTGQISLTLEQQRERERMAMQDFLQNPDNFQTNGMIDVSKLNKVVPTLAPLTGSDYIQKFTTLAGAQTEAEKAKQNLTQDQRAMIAQRFGILGRLGVQDVRAYLSEMELLKKENPDNPSLNKLIDSYKTIWQSFPSGPFLPQIAVSGANTLLPVATQEQLFGQKPGTISTGAATFPTVTQTSAAGGAPIQQVGQTPLAVAQMPPGSQMVPTGEKDINNMPIVNVFDVNGRFLGQMSQPATPTPAQLPGAGPLPTPTGRPVAPVVAPPAPAAMAPTPMAPAGVPGQMITETPVGGVVPMTRTNIVEPDRLAQQRQMTPPAAPTAPVAPAAPAARPAVPGQVARMRPGETAETYALANRARIQTADAAQQAVMQTFNNNQIIRLADEAITGRGAGTLANLTGGYAAFNAIGLGGGNATALNQLGHYMSLQTATLAQSSGLGTDAARAIAAESTGTINWTPEAIRKTAQVNRALSTATDLFNRGVQAEFKKTEDPISYRDFQSKWSQTADINAIRLVDAVRNNDKSAIQELVKEVGGKDSPGYKRLMGNVTAMEKLIKGQ